ncbi:VMA21-like domain protein [Necator americanus]|nr:VMA21-like domain protein [Necator americanus]ETN76811.1 VMA21-like domain protein [Necator americanus]
MSVDYDVVRGDSSSSISTTGSFENVTGPCVSESNGSRSSPVVKEGNEEVESLEEMASLESSGSSVTGEVCSNEQLHTPAHTRRAISNLIKFSAAMFVIPLLTMFTMYHYVFRDYFHLPPDQAMLYAGICGIAAVIIIVIVFIYVAYREEKEDENTQKLMKKSE